MNSRKNQSKFTIRPATTTDAHFIWSLRNSAAGRHASMNEKPISLSQHTSWFPHHVNEYSIVNNNQGFIRYDSLGYLSIMLIPQMRDKGFGKKILTQLTGKAIIRLDNPLSYHTFIKAGWRLKGFYLEK